MIKGTILCYCRVCTKKSASQLTCGHRNDFSYYVRFRIGKKQKQVFGGTKKADAQRKLVEVQNELNKGTYVEYKDVLFQDFAEDWLSSHAEIRLKTSTYENYRNTIKCHLSPVIGQYYLRQITKRQVHTLVSELSKKRSKKTVNNVLVLLRTMFKYAVKMEYLRENPALAVDKLKVERTEMDCLNPSEIHLLLQHAHEPYKTLFLTAASTGMRMGEILGLQWGDLDWNASLVYVRRTVYWFRGRGMRENNRRWKFTTPKTKRSARAIVMSPKLKEALEIHRISTSINEHDLVFCQSSGNPIEADNLRNRHFKPTLRFAGIRDVPFHALRHSYTSLLIAQNQNIKFIQSQLGHASAQFTLDRYGHLFTLNAEEVGKKLDAQLFNSHVNTMSTKVEETGEKAGQQEHILDSVSLTNT